MSQSGGLQKRRVSIGDSVVMLAGASKVSDLEKASIEANDQLEVAILACS